jgi:response regulator of citrate/malate metabolism
MEILIEPNSKEKFENELEEYKNKFSAWLKTDELRVIGLDSAPEPVPSKSILTKIKEVFS